MSDRKQADGPGRKSTAGILVRLLGFMRPHWRLAGGSMACLMAASLLELAIPRVVRNIIQLLEGEGTTRIDLSPHLKWLLFLACAMLAARFLRTQIHAHMVQSILGDLRYALFGALQRLSFRFHSSRNTGQLITHASRDITRARMFLAMVIFNTTEIVIIILGAIWIIWRIHPSLAVIVAGTVVTTSVLILKVAGRLRDYWRLANDAYGEITTVMEEGIQGIRVVKAFSQEKREILKFEDRAKSFYQRVLDAISFWSSRIPMIQFIFGFSTPAILGWGGYLVIRDTVHVGDLAACLLYTFAIGNRMRMIGQIANGIQQAVAASERIFEVLDAEPDIQPPAHPIRFPDRAARIRFQNVSFAYSSHRSVLDRIHFTITPNETFAFIGPTGSGKSTLVSLIPRFHDPQEGIVSINGVNVKDLDLRELRMNIGFVFQETFLFSASIADNIAYGKPDADMDAIIRAAEAAQAHDFIASLEAGYETVIGERGVTLSGGQRQRIAIARAFLLDPRILIMDDATASVDSNTEHLIRNAIRNIARDRTTIIIAQRISSVAHADRIAVMDQGKILAIGTHEELIRGNAIYRSLYETQIEVKVHS